MKKWVTRVGLLEVNDPKEYASSTYKGPAEEDNVITKREMVEEHNISDCSGSDNNLLGSGSKKGIGCDVMDIITDMGPVVHENDMQQQQQALHPNTRLYTEEEIPDLAVKYSDKKRGNAVREEVR